MTFEHDEARRRVVVTVRGEFHADDAREALARLREQGLLRHALLYDLTHATFTMTNDELDGLVVVATPTIGEPARGPIAVIAPDRDVYLKACRYAARARRLFRIQVFADRTEAEAWLASMIR